MNAVESTNLSDTSSQKGTAFSIVFRGIKFAQFRSRSRYRGIPRARVCARQTGVRKEVCPMAFRLSPPVFSPFSQRLTHHRWLRGVFALAMAGSAVAQTPL